MGNGYPLILFIAILTAPVWGESAVDKSTQSTDNAAIVYRKAFDTYKPPENGLEYRLDQYIRCKEETSEEIRRHVDKNREIISLALQATQLKKCVWGTENQPAKEWSDMLLTGTTLIGIHRLEQLLLADARIQFENGNIDDCLRKALACYRMAEQIGPLMYISQLNTESKTNTLLRWALAQDRLSQGRLKILSNRLVLIQKNRQGLLPAFDRETQETTSVLSKMTEKDIQEFMKSFPNTMAVDPNQTVEIQYTTPAAIKIVQLYTEHRKLLKTIIRKPYMQSFEELQRFKDDFMLKKTQAERETFKMTLDGAEVLCSYCNATFFKVFNIDVTTRAAFNANEAAIVILLEKHRTGKLPDALPKGLPRDPFSDKDFEYKKTDFGFVLRCRQEDLENHKTHEYEFYNPNRQK